MAKLNHFGMWGNGEYIFRNVSSKYDPQAAFDKLESASLRLSNHTLWYSLNFRHLDLMHVFRLVSLWSSKGTNCYVIMISFLYLKRIASTTFRFFLLVIVCFCSGTPAPRRIPYHRFVAVDVDKWQIKCSLTVWEPLWFIVRQKNRK